MTQGKKVLNSRVYNKKHPYGAVSLHPSRKYDQSFYWRILPWNQFSFAAAACVSACVHMVCVCVCVWSRERFCGVSAAGRCGGFGFLLRVSLSGLGSSGRSRSRSAGRSPDCELLSAGDVCTPAPPSARAYRSVTRSVGRSRALPHSPKT